LQSDGSVVTVFFKPGFLASAEELWGRWEGSKGTAGDGVGGVAGGEGKTNVGVAVGV